MLVYSAGNVLAGEDVTNLPEEVVPQEWKAWTVGEDPHAEVGVELNDVLFVVPLFDRHLCWVNQPLAISLQRSRTEIHCEHGPQAISTRLVLPAASRHLR